METIKPLQTSPEGEALRSPKQWLLKEQDVQVCDATMKNKVQLPDQQSLNKVASRI